MSDTSKPWYHKGLRFECTECGKCCTGAPGYVWISEEEITEMARFLAISEEEFSEKYVRKVGTRYSLIESPKTYDCVFLKDKKCQVYGARPKQCRTYPWWPQNLLSKETWEQTARDCEGIHKDAPLVQLQTIQEQSAG